jgi:hypothetical protein
MKGNKKRKRKRKNAFSPDVRLGATKFNTPHEKKKRIL